MNIEGLIRNAGNGTDSNAGDKISNAALMEDEEMIEGAVAHLRPMLEGAVTRAIDEVGDFLFQWFFAKSFDRYCNTHEGHVSLDAVLTFCGSVELWVSRTYLYNALRLAAYRGRLAEVGQDYHQLSPSHRIEVLRLDSDTDIAEISKKAFQEGFTVLEVRRAVSAKLGVEEPAVGPLVLRTVKAFNKGSADPTTGEFVVARAHFDYLTPGSWAQAKLAVRTAKIRMEALDEILGEVPPPPRPRKKKGEEGAPGVDAKGTKRRASRGKGKKKGGVPASSRASSRRRNEPAKVTQPAEKTAEKVDQKRAAPIAENAPEMPASKAEETLIVKAAVAPAEKAVGTPADQADTAPVEEAAQAHEKADTKPVATTLEKKANTPAEVVQSPAPALAPESQPVTPVEETGTEARERFLEQLTKEQADLGVRQLLILKVGPGPCAYPRPKAASRFKVTDLDVDSGDKGWAALANAGFDSAKPALVLAIGVATCKKPSFLTPIYRKVALMAPGSTLAMTYVIMSSLIPMWAYHEYREVALAAFAAHKLFVSVNPKGVLQSSEAMGLGARRVVAFVELPEVGTRRVGPPRALIGEHILVASR